MLRVVLVAAAVVLLCGPVSAAPNVVSTNYAASSTAAKQAQAPALKEPVIVTSLSALKEHKDTPEPKRWSPLPYPNNDDHEWVHHMKTLQKVIEEREKEMAVLQEQERKGQEERHKLLHMQKLLHSMAALHQSEVVLNKLDAHINKYKAEIKRLGDEAEEAMRGRDELKKQLEDELKGKADELQKLRARLAQHENMLTALCTKRADVAQTVSQWREFVGRLKGASGIASGSSDALSIPELPRPPTESEASAEEEAANDAASEGETAEGSGAEGDEGSDGLKAPVEEITAQAADSTADGSSDAVDTDSITAHPHEIKATHDSIEELLGVHLPHILGQAGPKPAAKPAFIETGHRLLRRNV